jgi:hypothetical protein
MQSNIEREIRCAVQLNANADSLRQWLLGMEFTLDDRVAT